jgi:hypothetical protein
MEKTVIITTSISNASNEKIFEILQGNTDIFLIERLSQLGGASSIAIFLNKNTEIDKIFSENFSNLGWTEIASSEPTIKIYTTMLEENDTVDDITELLGKYHMTVKYNLIV